MEKLYQTFVKTECQVGTYGWCGNNYEGQVSGYYLTVSKKASEYIMLRLSIHINDELLEKIEQIRCFDKTGFLAQYSKGVKSDNVLFYSISKELLGTPLKICYGYFSPNPQRIMLGNFSTVHEETIIIPHLNLKGDLNCSICVEDVVKDGLITPCGHIFHMDCIWKYLKTNNKLIDEPKMCLTLHCSHGKFVNHFDCPMCRRTLSGN